MKNLLRIFSIALLPALTISGEESGVFFNHSPTTAKSGLTLEEDTTKGGHHRVRGGTVLRERHAGVSFSQLREVQTSHQREHEGRASFKLELFQDAAWDVEDIRTTQTARGYSLNGRLVGVPFGTVTLVVNDDTVIGTVRTPTGTYSIDPAGRGFVYIREVDPSDLPPLGEPIPAHQGSMGSNDTASKRPSRIAVSRSTSAASREGIAVVDTLLVFTPAVRKAMGGERAVEALMDLIIAESNHAFEESGVDMRLFLTRTGEVDYQETGHGEVDLDRLRRRGDGYMDIIHEWRNATGADVVHLQLADSNIGGTAYMPDDMRLAEGEVYTFSVAVYYAGTMIATHEIGHNMGLQHDRFVYPGTPHSVYFHGYVNQAGLAPSADNLRRWHTIMAYSSQCHSVSIDCSLLPRFSNAEHQHLGDPLGVGVDTENEGAGGPADAARFLNEVRWEVAEYNSEVTDLRVETTIDVRTLQPNDVFTIEAQIANQGGIDSTAIGGRWYRSSDASIGSEDSVLGTIDLQDVPGRSVIIESIDLVAPDDFGDHYYGLCIDSAPDEEDVANNCSTGLRVTVGPTVSIANAQNVEGMPVSFDVTLSESRPSDVEIRFEVLPAQSSEGVDYRLNETSLVTIPAGETNAKIHVESIDDAVVDGDDTFSVRLLNTGQLADAGVAIRVDQELATGTITDNDGEPTFVDPQLEDAVRFELHKLQHDPISLTDMTRLTQLRAWGRDIESLSGLESATNLRSVFIHSNAIADLTPLRHLPRLEKLWLNSNPVTDLTPLRKLPFLRELHIDTAGFTDLTELAPLVKLRSISLVANGITDISPLANLDQLVTLDLFGNAISDLSPLRHLEHLAFVNLANNLVSDLDPLAELSAMRHLDLQVNQITNIGALSNLKVLNRLNLNSNAVVDVTPLADLRQLSRLEMANNRIEDIGPLEHLTLIQILDLWNNRISSIDALADIELLLYLNLANNEIEDIEPLSRLKPLPTFLSRYIDLADNNIADVSPLITGNTLTNRDTLDITGNPLNDETLNTGIPTLRSLGVTITYIEMSILASAAIEGQPLIFPVILDLPSTEDLEVPYSLNALSAEEGADFVDSGAGKLEVSARSTFAEVVLPTNIDDDSESVEGVSITLTTPGGGGGGVKIERSSATGIIVDPDGLVTHVPFFPDSLNQTRESFLRIFNFGKYGVGHLNVFDDAGRSVSVPFSIISGSTRRVDLQDVMREHTVRRLRDRIDDRDQRIEVRGDGLFVRTYARTEEGFIADLHDLVSKSSDGYLVPIFNPAENMDEISLLRLINLDSTTANVTIEGIDDQGTTSPGKVSVTLEPGTSRTLSAQDLESGDGLNGALGSGQGRWRLLVNSDQNLAVSNLMKNSAGYITNLSIGASSISQTDDGESVHLVPFLPTTSDPSSVEGLVRVINKGDPGTIQIAARDDTDLEARMTTLTIGRGETVEFSSHDLEMGNTAIGLSPGTGSGEGNWWLELTTALDVIVLAYTHLRNDALLSNMHDFAPRNSSGVYLVPYVTPVGNTDYVSSFRLINTGSSDVPVTIFGFDEEHKYSSGRIGLTLAAFTSRDISVRALEQGEEGLTGSLGPGAGAWVIGVSTDQPIVVMGLLTNPTGHLTNVSSFR